MDLNSALILTVVALAAFGIAFGMFYIKMYETRQHLEMIESLTSEIVDSHILNAEQNQTIAGLQQELRNACSTIEMVLNEREKPCSQEHSSSSSDLSSEPLSDSSLVSPSESPQSESELEKKSNSNTVKITIDKDRMNRSFEQLRESMKKLGDSTNPPLDKEPHVQEDDPVQGLQREGSEPADPPQSE